MFLITGVGDTKPKPIHEVYSNGFALPQASIKYNNSHYSSDFDTTLYISNISFSDAGTYSCSIRTDSKSFELYVIGKEQTSQTLDYPYTFSIFGPPYTLSHCDCYWSLTIVDLILFDACFWWTILHF